MKNIKRITFALLLCSQVGSLAYAEESNAIPEPTLLIQENTDMVSAERVQINRIAGCYGDIDTARINIVSSSGLLKDPYFSEVEYSPSIFALQPENPACVYGNEPKPQKKYEGHTMSLWDFAYGAMNCECGDCGPDNGEYFPTSEIEENISDEVNNNYHKYLEQRAKEVEIGKQNYELYMDDYKVWHHKRTTELSPVAIHMRVIPQEDMPAGALTVYNFVWQEFWGCEGLDSADRKGLHARVVQHPSIKAGESLDIWLDDVDIHLSWGVVMHSSPQHASADLQRIKEQARFIQSQNIEERQNWLPLRTLPASLDGRIYETPKARSSQVGSDCGCSC